ncbi:unnamed protein product, partial [Meganyctiphanes norvegica]
FFIKFLGMFTIRHIQRFQKCISNSQFSVLRGIQSTVQSHIRHSKDPPGVITVEKKDVEYEDEKPRDLLNNAVSFKAESPIGPDDVWTQGPYPHNSNYRQSQAKHSHRPAVAPESTSIVLFPGQGNQFVGMGKDLLEYPNVQEMFEAASAILGYNLLKVCLEGPKSELDRTQVQQLAIFVTSLAAVEKLREEHPEVLESCVATAGFSIGEITALTFAGAFDFEDAIRLVKVRAEAMQLATELTPSGMMTVFYGADSRLGFACSVAKEFCQAQGLSDVDCRVANYLYPHCKVIAGNEEALEFIAKNKEEFRLRRLKRLPVSGAFHTDLMRSAVDVFKMMLNKIHMSHPVIPVHSNIDGKPYKNIKQIRRQLPKQIYSPVKWEQTMHILFERSQGTSFPKTYECGPGRSLKTILKMVNSKAFEQCHNV